MNLAELPPFAEDGSLNVIVETPRGSRNKYSYDPLSGLFQLKKILPVGMNFPFDFGFIPGTKGGDGDPLDILVLMDEPGFPGTLVRTRLLGVLQAKQTENGKSLRNDRLLGQSLTSSRKKTAKDIADLGSDLLDEIEAFFANYNQLDGRKFMVLARAGAKKAFSLIESAREI
jgi:inorganic pyrophosphatase